MPPTPSIAVFASGRGSNLAALFAAHDRGDLSVPIALVISNNSAAQALALALARDVPTAHISATTHADPAEAVLAALRGVDASILVLAGYMKLLDPRVVRAFSGRIINIHPAPLPRFGGPGMYGMRVHEAVLSSGVSETGPTVHLVEEHYDNGTVLAFRPIEVRADDDAEALATRVLEAEHDLLWRVLEETYGPSAAID